MDDTEWGQPAWLDGAAALKAWLKSALDVELADEPIVPGHESPFDYVQHVFFEDGSLLRGADESAAVVPEAVVWANRGGGKTFLGAIATLLDLVFKPGVEIRILGGSLDQSKRMHAHLLGFLSRPGLAELVEGRPTQKRLTLRNGSSVELLAASQTSVRGTRVQKLRCDEVELFTPELWEAAQLVTRSKPITLGDGRTVTIRGSVECLSTMHVPYGVMHRVVEEARSGVRRLFRWGVVDVLERCRQDNCERCDDAEPTCPMWGECQGRAQSLVERTPGHVTIDDALRLKRRVSEAVWQSEMLSLRPRRTDCVLPEFDPNEHVVDAEPEEGEWLCGMDFGFRAPTVVLFGVVDASGVLTIVAEHVKAEAVLAEHIRAIAEGPRDEHGELVLPGFAGPSWVGVDPAGRQRNDQTGKSDVQAMRAAGLVVKHRRLALHAGLNLLRARLRPAADDGPRLMVHRRCAKLIECLERYHYPSDQPESMVPVKDGFDHAVDALRYLVQNLDAGYEAKVGKTVW